MTNLAMWRNNSLQEIFVIHAALLPQALATANKKASRRGIFGFKTHRETASS